jgi:hypothetical protein
MTTKLPPSRALSLAHERHVLASESSKSSTFGLWTGTREGLVATVIAVAGALLFGGAAGAWFSVDGSVVMAATARIALGSVLMASLVSLIGTMLAGRNPIFWGIGMPLLVYGAGAFCAFVSGHAGAAMLFFGAPLFCGLAIAAGVMTAFAVDRDR